MNPEVAELLNEEVGSELAERIEEYLKENDR